MDDQFGNSSSPTTDRILILTLWEPWASLIVYGYKKIETRPKATIHNGTYLIHAGKSWNPIQASACRNPWFIAALLEIYPDFDVSNPKDSFQLGNIIGAADMNGSYPQDVICLGSGNDWGYNVPAYGKAVVDSKEFFFHAISRSEEVFGNWGPGRWAWLLKNPRVLVDPIPFMGKQGYYTPYVEDESKLIYK